MNVKVIVAGQSGTKRPVWVVSAIHALWLRRLRKQQKMVEDSLWNFAILMDAS